MSNSSAETNLPATYPSCPTSLEESTNATLKWSDLMSNPNVSFQEALDSVPELIVTTEAQCENISNALERLKQLATDASEVFKREATTITLNGLPENANLLRLASGIGDLREPGILGQVTLCIGSGVFQALKTKSRRNDYFQVSKAIITARPNNLLTVSDDSHKLEVEGLVGEMESDLRWNTYKYGHKMETVTIICPNGFSTASLYLPSNLIHIHLNSTAETADDDAIRMHRYVGEHTEVENWRVSRLKTTTPPVVRLQDEDDWAYKKMKEKYAQLENQGWNVTGVKFD